MTLTSQSPRTDEPVDHRSSHDETAAETRAGARSRFSQRGTLFVVCLATAMLMPDVAVVNTALSHIASDLDSGLSGLQWVVDAYALGLATVVLSAGSLADRIGLRSMFLRFRLPSAPGRSPSTAGRSAPRSRSGRWVGGALTSYISWRAVFFVNIPLGFATIVATYLWVRESRESSTHELDRPGQATLMGGLFLLVFALLRGNEAGWSSASIVASLATAGTLLALFAPVEARSRAPMLPLDLFRRPDFVGVQVATFAISACRAGLPSCPDWS